MSCDTTRVKCGDKSQLENQQLVPWAYIYLLKLATLLINRESMIMLQVAQRLIIESISDCDGIMAGIVGFM